MSYSGITSALAAIVSAVTGTANVYQYRRYNSGSEDQMKTLFEDSSIINTWQISRVAATSEFDGSGQCDVQRTGEFAIHGYYSIDDSNASEMTFQALVDSVMARLDLFSNRKLLGAIERFAQPAQLTTIESVMYGSVGCWYCEIRVYPVELIATV